MKGCQIDRFQVNGTRPIFVWEFTYHLPKTQISKLLHVNVIINKLNYIYHNHLTLDFGKKQCKCGF